MSHFDVGPVLKDTIAVLEGKTAVLAVLALSIFGVGMILELMLPGPTRIAMSQSEFQVISGTIWTGFVIDILCYGLLTIVATYAVYRHFQGGPTTIGDCISGGVPMIPTVVGISVLSAIVIGVASLFLIVPGIYVYLVLWVALPAALIENTGIVGGFKRSAELTRNERWPVFIVTFILFIPIVAAGFLIDLMPFGGPPALIAYWVLTALSNLLLAVGTAVGYFHLRSGKSRLSIEEIVNPGGPPR
ncbi:MAG: hypothetical protein MI741_15650 [Rhodospirillales bacterium]|nr:hypothetical protein [Rhodospirillales bacterium]